ncbi:hypothetical protein C8R44DRAFT_298608 [Mycena epipterygia]|nr:hypothetical protein C8R44DRAFT_298608 [Mycena epipterygia]
MGFWIMYRAHKRHRPYTGTNENTKTNDMRRTKYTHAASWGTITMPSMRQNTRSTRALVSLLQPGTASRPSPVGTLSATQRITSAGASSSARLMNSHTRPPQDSQCVYLFPDEDRNTARRQTINTPLPANAPRELRQRIPLISAPSRHPPLPTRHALRHSQVGRLQTRLASASPCANLTRNKSNQKNQARLAPPFRLSPTRKGPVPPLPSRAQEKRPKGSAALLSTIPHLAHLPVSRRTDESTATVLVRPEPEARSPVPP